MEAWTVSQVVTLSDRIVVLFDERDDLRFPAYRVRVMVTRPNGSKDTLEANVEFLLMRPEERIVLVFHGLSEQDVPVASAIELIENEVGSS